MISSHKPELEKLYQEIGNCRRCNLAQYRTKVVPGEGAGDAEIMFIGEAPGWHEDHTGRPFVGPAGQLLDELLASIGLKREEVYIANVIKCRPPDNRDPLPQEIAECHPFLEEQIRLIRPRLVVTLGRHSAALFFPGKSISHIHGHSETRDGVVYYAMYHPAAALHQQKLRQALEDDIKKIPGLLEQTCKEASRGNVVPSPPPQQLSLFDI